MIRDFSNSAKKKLLEYVKDGVLIGDKIKQKIEDLEVSI